MADNGRKGLGGFLRGAHAAETIVGALAVAALLNLVAVLALGVYEFTVAGRMIRSQSLAWSLALVVALFAARWLVSLPRVGFFSSLRSCGPTGAVVAAVGVLLLFLAASTHPVSPPVRVSLTVSGLGAAGFLFAWLAYGRGFPLTARLVAAVLYLLLSSGLGRSLGYPKSWIDVFHFKRNILSKAGIPAERTGLLCGEGWGVSFEKVAAGNDWRAAAVVSTQGFFSARASVQPGHILKFAVARSREAGSSKAVVTILSGESKEVVWEAPARALEQHSWRDVAVPLVAGGDLEVVFEVSGHEKQGEVYFANPCLVPAPGKRRQGLNIILVVVDALRADRLGLYGYKRPTSGPIDKLASSAVVFEDCVAVSSWTLPSMGTILTSLHPSAHGMTTVHKGLSGDLVTVTEVLRNAGYYTGCVQANPHMGPQAGVAQGFAEYLHLPVTLGQMQPYARAEEVNTAALDWLERNSDRPFFLYLHYMDVHSPFRPPERFRIFGSTESDLYDGEIASFSEQFGGFVEELRGRGLLADTVLILTGDHGEQFYEHGWQGHGRSLYGEEMQVPLVFWLPGANGGRRVNQRVGGIDLAPTLLEIANAPPLLYAQGRSLMPALAGGAIEKAPAFSELETRFPPGQFLVSLTEGRYRFIVSNPTSASSIRCELYDLERDPSEYANLVGASSGIVDEMKDRVDQYILYQRTLHLKLVAEELVLPLTRERHEKLRALGYLN